jgi:APA family basic amino acid/polyamine antiporter
MIGIEPMRSVVTVAPLVMERLVGAWGGLTVTLIILVSTLGATHCSIITGARVTFAQACDGLLFKALARIHPRYKTPDVSLWVQGLLSCAAVILLRDFDSLTKGFVFMMWIFYGAAAVSLIVLRIRRPDLPRPYRCFGYPYIPLAFILSTTGMTILSICESPEQSFLWLATLLAGVPAYFVWQYVQRRKLRGGQ